MKITGRVRILDSSGFGVWRVEAAASELGFLGEPCSQAPGRSILGLKGYEISEGGDFLIFQLSDVSVLNLGSSYDSIAVVLREAETERPSEQEIGARANTQVQVAEAPVQELRFGDDAFIAACRSEQLPETIVELGQDFLRHIREFSDDTLREGKSRKWVTYPKNFLALTIQNRNKQFCVHVKKSSLLDSLSNDLDIRDDRPGYVRFWLQDESQIEAAVRAAKSSFRM